MKISYTLTIKEFQKFQNHYRWTVLRNRLIINMIVQLVISVGVSLFLGMPLIMVIWLADHKLPNNISVLVWVSLTSSTLVLFSVTRLFAFIRYRSRVRLSYRNVYSERSLSVIPQYLLSETSVAKTEYKWNSIRHVLIKPDIIMVFIGKSGTLIIPTRVFQSENEMREFLRLIEDYRNQTETSEIVRDVRRTGDEDSSN